MFVYQLCQGNVDESIHDDFFDLEHRILIKEIEGFSKFAMQFKYKRGERDVLIFATQEKIFEFNYVTKTIKDVVVFTTSLSRQPEFFLTDTA